MSRTLSRNCSNQRESLVFCDFLKISIPLRRDLRYAQGGQSVYDGQGVGLCDRLWSVDFSRLSQLTGISLRASSVNFDESGRPSFAELTHSFESVASSHATLTFVARQCASQTGLPPRVEVQCSPAALSQIQNVVSAINSIESAAWIILASFAQALPRLMPFLDVENAQVFRVDSTDSLLCDTPAQAGQVLRRMGEVSVRQQRAFTGDTNDVHVARLAGFETTRYWNPRSEMHSGVAYLKGAQLVKKRTEAERDCRKNPTSLVAAERLRVLSIPAMHQMADRMVRLEARWKKRGLIDQLCRLNLTTTDRPWDGRLLSLIELERTYNSNPHSTHENFLTALWDTSWRPLLEALDGAENMDLSDYAAIEKAIFTANTPRRARPLVQFFHHLTQIGFHDLKKSALYSRSTFHRRVCELQELGVSLAQLQSLDGTAESRIDAGVVIPMRRVLSVGRMTQLPDWFEPVDLDQWAPFDPSIRRAVGAPVGPVPRPVQQERATPVAAELPSDAEILEFFAPGAPEPICSMPHPDGAFSPSMPSEIQLGLDFSGPDSTVTRGRGSNAGFTRAVEQIRAAQVVEGLQLGVQRTLIDGTEFVPPIATIIPIRRGQTDGRYAHVRD